MEGWSLNGQEDVRRRQGKLQNGVVYIRNLNTDLGVIKSTK
jgi:hypothetical protein